MTLRKSLGLFALTLIASSAFADSDGYFCVGPDFLAFELRLPDGRHVLNIISPTYDQKLDRRSIEIPDFQVHGMRCNTDKVEIDGWERRVQVLHLWEDNPRISSVAVAKPGEDTDRMGRSENLAEWNADLIVGKRFKREMPWRGPKRYALTVDHQPTEEKCRYSVTARLVFLAPDGDELMPSELLKREFKRDCG